MLHKLIEAICVGRDSPVGRPSTSVDNLAEFEAGEPQTSMLLLANLSGDNAVAVEPNHLVPTPYLQCRNDCTVVVFTFIPFLLLLLLE